VLCNLVPIAQRVGAPRVVPTRGIQFPTGDPSLPAVAERAWRRRLLETALRAVATPVDRPTVFDPAEPRAGVAETPDAAAPVAG
jgi:glycine reductase complex component B subunit gamma